LPQISSPVGFAKHLSWLTRMLALVAALTLTQLVLIGVHMPS
jgi:hypothetical protein